MMRRQILDAAGTSTSDSESLTSSATWTSEVDTLGRCTLWPVGKPPKAWAARVSRLSVDASQFSRGVEIPLRPFFSCLVDVIEGFAIVLYCRAYC
jgi:hypothetical protein